jgi:hypothetical protein
MPQSVPTVIGASVFDAEDVEDAEGAAAGREDDGAAAGDELPQAAVTAASAEAARPTAMIVAGLRAVLS